MTARLRKTSIHLIVMGSRWCVLPGIIGSVGILENLLSDPVSRMEALLAPYAETAAPETAVAPWRAAKAPDRPRAGPPTPSSTEMAGPAASVVDSILSVPKLVNSEAPLTESSSPQIAPAQSSTMRRTVKQSGLSPSSPAAERGSSIDGERARLMPQKLPTIAKIQLRPPLKRAATDTAAPVTDNWSEGASAPTVKTVRHTSTGQLGVPDKMTRLVFGEASIGTVLGSNIRARPKMTQVGPIPHRVSDSIEFEWSTRRKEGSLSIEDELPLQPQLSKTASRTNQTPPPRSQAAASMPEQVRRRAAADGSGERQNAEWTEPATANYDELWDEFERRLTWEYLRHYGTSGV